MERHYFAGANTPKGFVTYFQHILDPTKGERIYILKGGSGVGKSTAIQKIACRLLEMGHDVEYVRCSSDENSYDGFCAPKIGIAMMDGTAPHIVEPLLPGACEVIINLSEYLDATALQPLKQEIHLCNQKKAALYRDAYMYLASAKHIFEHINDLYDTITNENALHTLTSVLCKEIFQTDRGLVGSRRRLFAEAITGHGFLNYSHTLFAGCQVYSMDKKLPRNSARLLEKIADYANATGYDIECFYNTYDSEAICHVVIPDLKIAFTNEVIEGSIVVPLYNTINQEQENKLAEAITKNQELADHIVEYAISSLMQTKKHHDELEQIYATKVDFKEVDTVVEQIWEEILEVVLC